MTTDGLLEREREISRLEALIEQAIAGQGGPSDARVCGALKSAAKRDKCLYEASVASCKTIKKKGKRA